MSEIVERLAPPMNSVVLAAWYRTLGMNSIHASIEDVTKFIEADDNPYGGELNRVHSGKFYEVHKWESINISDKQADDPIEFDTWIFGGGVNTVFVREKWWDLHLVRRRVEQRFGLERGELSFLGKDAVDDSIDVVSNSPLTRDQD